VCNVNVELQMDTSIIQGKDAVADSLGIPLARRRVLANWDAGFDSFNSKVRNVSFVQEPGALLTMRADGLIDCLAGRFITAPCCYRNARLSWARHRRLRRSAFR
jgi:hypothetical protein